MPPTASRATRSCSRSAAATTCRSPRSTPCGGTFSATTSSPCSTTWAPPGACSPTTPSCAGSGPRRASCTWRSARPSTRCGTSRPSAPGSRSGGCSPGCSPEELVAIVDFRYLTDAITPDEALEILRRAEPGRAERTAALLATGYPAYTTTPGWLGYSDEKLDRLCREAVADGFPQIKLKVGADLDDDRRRLAIARGAVGDGLSDRDRREPAVGCRGRDRLGQRARRVRPRVDRGADESRRHPRPCRDRPRGGSRPSRDR